MVEIKIPNLIDEPPYLLLWRADEFIPVMVGLSFGMMIDKKVVLTSIGLVVAYAYRKYRDNTPDGYLLHLLYKSGFLPANGRSMINPFITRLFP
jgi:conjugal transfer pilus assembly protein TraL